MGTTSLAFESLFLFCHLGEVIEISEFQFSHLLKGGNCINKVV